MVSVEPWLKYLQVKRLCAWCLNLHSEASILNHNHFLFIGIIARVGVTAAILLGLRLLGLVVPCVAVHHYGSCTVPCGPKTQVTVQNYTNYLYIKHKNTERAVMFSREENPQCPPDTILLRYLGADSIFVIL